VEESPVVEKKKHKIKMRDYHLIPPEKEMYCVCSVIQAIFDRLDVNISQEEIAERLTPSAHGFLVDDKRMRNLIEGHDFSYEFFWRNQVPLNDPELVLWEMEEHSGFIGIGNHLFFVRGYNYPSLEVLNPENCETEIIVYREMDRKMRESKKGCFGLIKKLD